MKTSVSEAAGAGAARNREDMPSLVMKEINSLTHSCIHSFASLAILAFSGSASFMIRATGAKLRMLASEATFAMAPWEVAWGGEDDKWGEEDDIP